MWIGWQRPGKLKAMQIAIIVTFYSIPQLGLGKVTQVASPQKVEGLNGGTVSAMGCSEDRSAAVVRFRGMGLLLCVRDLIYITFYFRWSKFDLCMGRGESGY